MQILIQEFRANAPIVELFNANTQTLFNALEKLRQENNQQINPFVLRLIEFIRTNPTRGYDPLIYQMNILNLVSAPDLILSYLETDGDKFIGCTDVVYYSEKEEGMDCYMSESEKKDIIAQINGDAQELKIHKPNYRLNPIGLFESLFGRFALHQINNIRYMRNKKIVVKIANTPRFVVIDLNAKLQSGAISRFALLTEEKS